MSRDLLPRTVYLPPAAITEADRRADEKTIPVATLLRMILLGQEPPLAK
jgi:hypothetical protein